jgi:hypothetical protein
MGITDQTACSSAGAAPMFQPPPIAAQTVTTGLLQIEAREVMPFFIGPPSSASRGDWAYLEGRQCGQLPSIPCRPERSR